MVIGKNSRAFLELVKAGLWEKKARLLPFGDVDYAEIMRFAEEQSVNGLVTAGLEHVTDVNVPQEVVLQFVGTALQFEQQNKAMNVFIGELVEEMRIAGIYTLLVKGQGIGQCYERPLWRASGDVDLLLSEDNYNKATVFLQPLASHIKEEQELNKHIAMTINSWEVELHGSLRGGLWKEMDIVLDKVLKEVFLEGKVRSWMDGNTQVFLLRADEDVVYVFAHILEHFFKGGIGLRQICDWCRLLWLYREKLDLCLLESRLTEMGAVTEWKAFGAMAVYYLDMPEKAMPFYDSRFKAKGERILEFVMDVGNFGHNRDLSYYKTEPYLKRKAISFWRHTLDGITYFTIFPKDSFRLWMKMLFGGIMAVLKRR